MVANMNTDVRAAKQWREHNGYDGRGGVVVLYHGEVQGWCNELRNPEHWQPGCVAVDECGGQWVSTGGGAHEGATHWQPVDRERFSVVDITTQMPGDDQRRVMFPLGTMTRR